MADSTPQSYSTDPTLYLYTSLTAGSSHIVTATSRLQTILISNRISFQVLDVATDEKARMLWGRRAGKRKLPGLVRMGMVIGDLDQIEEWNEYDELDQNLGDDGYGFTFVRATGPATPTPTPSVAPSHASNAKSPEDGPVTPKLQAGESSLAAPEDQSTGTTGDAAKSSVTDAMRKLGEEAARVAGAKKTNARPGITTPAEIPTTTASTVLSSLQHAAIVPPPSGTIDPESSVGKQPVKAVDEEPTLTPDPLPATHQRAAVVDAPPEVIRQIEQSSAIPEEAEAEEGGHQESARHGGHVIESDRKNDPHGSASQEQDPSATRSESVAQHSSVAERMGGEATQAHTDAVAAKEAPIARAAELSTQEQPAAEGRLAGASVED
ncbi:MAG: hypothetical protein M1826_005725 [Phylliscum demangeonii]|nr:MAG: hypothetical protein M1826_005725 [Phylliscum demangeonii]